MFMKKKYNLKPKKLDFKEAYSETHTQRITPTEWDISITPLLKGKGDVFKRFKSPTGDLYQLARDEFGDQIEATNMRTPVQVDVRLKSGVRYVVRKVTVRI